MDIPENFWIRCIKYLQPLDIISLSSTNKKLHSIFKTRAAEITKTFSRYHVGILNNDPNNGLSVAITRGEYQDSIDLYISKGGYQDLIDFYISKGADDWGSALYWADAVGDEKLIKFFLAKIRLTHDPNDYGDMNVVRWANSSGHDHIVELLNLNGITSNN